MTELMKRYQNSAPTQEKPNSTADRVAAEVASIVSHLTEIEDNLPISAEVNRLIQSTFEQAGCVPYQTPTITHGMREYDLPLAKVENPDGTILGYLRCSPQFQKQLIAMVTEGGYVQIASSLRPGEVDRVHIPYLHQIDMERGFNTTRTSFNQAAHSTSILIEKAIRNALIGSGLEMAETVRISHRDAIKKYGTASPYLTQPGDSRIHLTIVEKPPLFQIKDNTIDTTILPMALPIFESEDQRQCFLLGEMTRDEMNLLTVHGYDFIASSPKVWVDNNGRREGLEIAGGSVRINDPELQLLILKIVRGKQINTLLPLIELLRHFSGSGIFTAGGAVGTERIAMIATESDCLSDILAMPWGDDGKPPFSSLVK